jgi:hypothetical protein
MRSIIVVYHGFSEINARPVFPPQINVALTSVIVQIGVFPGNNMDGVLFPEHLKDFLLEKIVERFGVMSY